MQIEVLIVLSAALFGIGSAAVLARTGILVVIFNIVTAFCGAIVATAVLSRHSLKSNEGLLFSMTLIVLLMGSLIMGCAMAYRRFMAAKARELDEKTELKH